MFNYKKAKFWMILASMLILILLSISLLSNQSEDLLFPPGENQEVILEAREVIYLKDASTNYSLGAVGSEFSFTKDKLVVKDEEKIKTFKISYDKTTITLDEFQKEVQMGEEFPNMDSYKKILRYDLCKATKDLPGYRLYILNDDTYWMATLYKNNVWRIISMKDSYWNYDE